MGIVLRMVDEENDGGEEDGVEEGDDDGVEDGSRMEQKWRMGIMEE